ncbi:MAG: type II secretion system F family protein [Acidimicrobiales bacterium]
MVLILALLVAGGAALVVFGLLQSRRPAGDVAGYLSFLETEARTDEFAEVLSASFVTRVVQPAAGALLGLIGRFTPVARRDRVRHQLTLAGLEASIPAEDFLAVQILAAVGGIVLGLLFMTLGHGSSTTRFGGFILAAMVGTLLPQSWLNRKIEARKHAIFMDLPDVLDLMAISVEAGVGFEAALDIVCEHFHTPLAMELARVLREMQLGLTRHEALQNLKRRTEVPELSNFILALLQADALGMPIGRVLHTQAGEMRTRRKMYAREKAAKMPVKILFPLVLFIFPAIMIVVVGPAWGGLSKAFSGGH